MKKLLIFTDSRGQHKPFGSSHDIFAEKLAKDSQLRVDMFLCPMKWTTTIDFLARYPKESLEKYDFVILFTGIVDWSPRPATSAYNDIYNNTIAANDANFCLNTIDYTKKIINNKKSSFDKIFGADKMAEHFSKPFDFIYEGEKTINMYSIEMAKNYIVPCLAKIKNLIFITSNKFVSGWDGDFKRGRPQNISITEKYANLFKENLATNNVIDLLQWDDRTVTEFTCDNIHLTQSGSDWIYEEIVSRINKNEDHNHSPVSTEMLKIDRSKDLSALEEYDLLITLKKDCEKFFNNRLLNIKTVTAGFPEAHVDLKYLDLMSFLYDDNVCNNIFIENFPVKNCNQLQGILRNIYSSDSIAQNYIADCFMRYKKRWKSEYQWLAINKINIFPYNYLSDYSFSTFIEDKKNKNETIKIDFIFCIKNRKKRATISINSLINSITAYKSSNDTLLNLHIIVVEDVSSDIFDPNQVAKHDTLDHYIVNTNLGWTRSGLLNVGIRNSNADLIALVDADFLFHQNFITSLSEYLSVCQWKKHVIACNLIETEAHIKKNVAFSALSPYSYMWIAPRSALREVSGLHEGYTGHGYEDRDLEFKLIKVCDLKVADTASIVPDCIVFHMSHHTRDGYENHISNREMFLSRKELPVEKLIQPCWGDQEVVWASRCSSLKPVQPRALPLKLTFSPKRYNTRPISFASNGHSNKRLLYMIISCSLNTERRSLLAEYFNKSIPKSDSYIFVVGGSKATFYDVLTRTLYLKDADYYEDLPEKVLNAISYCYENFDFSYIVKVDDDVIINLRIFKYLIESSNANYFGKMIPSKRGSKPSPTWHIGKVSKKSQFFDKPFDFRGGPENWCCGGAYVLSRQSAAILSEMSLKTNPADYLYEDHMVGSILSKSSIQPSFIEDHQSLNKYKFIQTDLREIMDSNLETFLASDLKDRIASVHCGSFPPLYSISNAKCILLMKRFMYLISNENKN